MTLSDLGAFLPDQIAVGGVHGYATLYTSLGAFDQVVSTPQPLVTGVAFRPTTGHLFSTSVASTITDGAQHDLDWLPNDAGLIVASVPTSGSLIFRQYDFSLAQTDEWSGSEAPDVEVGFGRQLTRISIACDSRTVFYTMMGRTTFRYDLTARANIAPYSTLSDADYARYLYGGLRVLPIPRETGDNRDVIWAMTRDPATGPQRAVAIASATEHWVDQINPSGAYVIQRRLNSDGTFVDEIETQADEGTPPANDYTLSIAVNVALCPRLRTPERITISWLN